MSDTTKEKINRFTTELLELRKHQCDVCGHPRNEHAFDIFPVDANLPEPCWKSCMVCFDNQTERLKKEGKLKYE